MKKLELFSYFNAALGWNAAFYGFYKVSSTGLTIFLFKSLSPLWFSCWATGNSLIFLFLLWIDCGFKKSIPRFCPLYLGINHHRQFITKAIGLRLLTLIVAIPFVWIGMNWWWGHPKLVPYIIFLFVTQGLATVFELLYHAHFWQREYAIMHTVSLLFEIICNIILLSSVTDSHTIVMGLFTNKSIASVLLVLFSLYLLPSLYKKTTLPFLITERTQKELKRSFIKYSLFMWWSTTIKSLSERNFLVPFFTITLGAPTANMFKVANDAALIFQRTILRTIGIADMSLLSYAMLEKSPNQLLQAFNYLLRTLIILTFPLATITVLVTKKFHTLATTDLVVLFSIIISGYMVEMLLSPYERLLEVEFKLANLFTSYLPYIIGYGILMLAIIYDYIGLVPYLGLTQTVRIISSISMVWYGYRSFNEPFPKILLYKVGGSCLLILSATWYFL